MKKVLVFASVLILAACNSKDSSKTESMKSGSDTSMTTMRDINSPYPIGYSSKFEMGDPAHAETVLALWKDFDNGTLSASRSRFADSLELYLADGSMMAGPTDSIIATVQGFRNMYTTVSSRVDAVTALRSIDKNENWALIWGMEKDTDKKGKVDSFFLQETWRFNKDGKANLLYQFRSKPPAPKK